MKPLQSRVAIVTGGANGIGAATACRLSGEGGKVVVADLDHAAAQELAAKIESAGGTALGVQADLGDLDSLRSAVDETIARFGRLDILHNNAAALGLAARDAEIVDADPEAWTETFRITVTGTMTMTKLAVPEMLRRGGGAIVNTASLSGVIGELHAPAYSASKAAIIALTRSTATYYGKQGIRCNAICPGIIRTDAVRRVLDEEALADQLRHFASPRLGLPDDVAAAVAFLAGPGGEYINGQAIVIDGGFSSHTGAYADGIESLRGKGAVGAD